MGSEVVRVHSEGACLAYPELKEVGDIDNAIACIRDDRAPAVSGLDGRAATAIGIAATRSLDEGRPVLVIEVP